MNENLDRIRHGWQPRADAHWFWWLIGDLIVLKWLVVQMLKRR